MSSSALAMDPNIQIIPGGYKVLSKKGNKLTLMRKVRHRVHKLSKKVRDAMSAARRRFKIPLLSGAAVAIPGLQAIESANKYGGISNINGLKVGLANLLASYTGFYFDPLGGSKPTWSLWNLMRGAGTLLAVKLTKRFGIFKGVNSMLTQNKIPVALT